MLSFITHYAIPRMQGVAGRMTLFSMGTLAVAARSLPKTDYSNSLEYAPPFFRNKSSGSNKMDMIPILMGIIVARSEDTKAGIRAQQQVINDQIDAIAREIFAAEAEWGELLKQYRGWYKKNPEVTWSQLEVVKDHERRAKTLQDWDKMPATVKAAASPLPLHQRTWNNGFRPPEGYQPIRLNIKEKHLQTATKGACIDFYRSTVASTKSAYDEFMALWKNSAEMEVRYTLFQEEYRSYKPVQDREREKTLALINKISELNHKLTPLLEESNKLEVAIYGTGGFFQDSKMGAAFALAIRDLSTLLSIAFPWTAPGIATALTTARILRAAIEGSVIGQPETPIVKQFLDLLQPSLARVAVNSVVKDQLASPVIVNRLNASIDVLGMLNSQSNKAD